MATALVTGASGFTGRYMAAALRRAGHTVLAVGGPAPGAHRSLACDLRDRDAVRKALDGVAADFVIHLAALSFVGHEDPEDFYRVNLFGTLNLLEAVAAGPRQPRKVVLASSGNVYGANARQVTDETVCPAPVNHYACSKLAMEHMARTWFDRLPIIITRPFNYTGIGQDSRFLIPKIVEHFRRGAASIRLGNTHVSRDFSDVRDVVAAYMALLTSDAESETVNICSGRSTPLDDILHYMEDISGRSLHVETDPNLVRSAELARLRGDNAKLRRLTGYAPGRTLPATLGWMYGSES